MHRLWHFRLCPFSRSIRMALGEHGVPCDLVEERPWGWRREFLGLNPAGELPVLEIDVGPVLCGVTPIYEFIAEETRRPPGQARTMQLLPSGREDRAEVRRLVDWFHRKMDREVTREMLEERLYTRLRGNGASTGDAELMRALRANLRYHVSYVAFLAYQRRWLAGDEASFADLAAAAHLSVLDYLDEVPWNAYPAAKEWYQRMKSRPALRAILAERLPGTTPPAHYANLDF